MNKEDCKCPECGSALRVVRGMHLRHTDSYFVCDANISHYRFPANCGYDDEEKLVMCFSGAMKRAEEEAKRGRPSKEEVLFALQVLQRAIGTYGHRNANEISIHFGNGIAVRENGVMKSGNINRVAEFIAELPPNSAAPETTVGAGESSPAPDSSTIAVKDGLLWRNGKIIKLPEADAVARQHGFVYAEQLVKHLTGT